MKYVIALLMLVFTASAKDEVKAEKEKIDVPPVFGYAVMENGKLKVTAPKVTWTKTLRRGKAAYSTLDVKNNESSFLIHRLKYNEGDEISQISEHAQNRVMTLAGRRLSFAEIKKKLTKRQKIVLSASGRFPSKFYLSFLNKDVLVIIPGIIESGVKPELLPSEKK